MQTQAKLYDVDAVAMHQGWIVLRRTAVKGDGAQASGFVTLCSLSNPQNRGQEYAAHFFNSQDGGFHFGSYSYDYDAVVKAYNEKRVRYTRHHVGLRHAQ